MGKKHVTRQRKLHDDNLIMSSVDDDVDFEASMHAMDRRIAKRDRQSAASKRNRFDDYQEDAWSDSQDNWDDFDYYNEDLDFQD